MANVDACSTADMRSVSTGEEVRASSTLNAHATTLERTENDRPSNNEVVLDDETREKLSKTEPLKLHTQWTFWYDRFKPNMDSKDYEGNLDKISTVGTVQDFWKVYNNIDGPEKLGFKCNFHFMREGIKPIWEDPANENGGAYNLKVDKEDSPKVWCGLLCLLIGEKLEDCLEDSIRGVSVSSRGDKHNYQIWVAHANIHNGSEGRNNEIKEKLFDQLAGARVSMASKEVTAFYFKTHKAHDDFQTTSERRPGGTKPYTPYNDRQKPSDQRPPLFKQDMPRNEKSSEPRGNFRRQRSEQDIRRQRSEQGIEKVLGDIGKAVAEVRSLPKPRTLQPKASSEWQTKNTTGDRPW